MLTGEQAYLLSALSQYGYSLFQPDQMADPNELLARMVESADARLLEGFPVVLANALEKHRATVSFSAVEKRLADETSRERFRRLVALSMYLFGVFGLENLRLPEYAREGRDALLSENANGAGRIFQWSLTRMSDVHGSTVYYTYSADQGQRYLDSIYYVSPIACRFADHRLLPPRTASRTAHASPRKFPPRRARFPTDDGD